MNALKETYFLRDLTPRELERIAAVADERSYATDAVIVEVNQDLTCLFVVREGRVRVVLPPVGDSGKPMGGGAAPALDMRGEGDPEDQRPAELGAGEAFGELSYADRKPAWASVVAVEPTRVLVIAHHDLDGVLASDASIARKVLGAMLERVVGQLRTSDADLLLARYVLRVV